MNNNSYHIRDGKCWARIGRSRIANESSLTLTHFSCCVCCQNGNKLLLITMKTTVHKDDYHEPSNQARGSGFQVFTPEFLNPTRTSLSATVFSYLYRRINWNLQTLKPWAHLLIISSTNTSTYLSRTLLLVQNPHKLL